jgi:isopentenyl diphosphate isomerase/L-lactate dehydrogenase-like FMN-dependent dehydrogenase
MNEQPLSLHEIPAGVHSAADYARLAAEAMDPSLFAYIEGGSGPGRTAAENLAAFANLGVVPQPLRRVSGGHTRCVLNGQQRPHPIMLAPVGSQALFHADAERASAAAAQATDTCFIASTMASLSLEDVAAVAGPDRWFQLYFQPDRQVTRDIVRRAETAGYTGLVVTVDTPIQLPSHRALEAGFVPPSEMANLRDYPKPPAQDLEPGESEILCGMMRGAPTFGDIDWLAQETGLPLWVKGILHPEDARELVTRGVSGIIVSNHGGRALDGAPASVSAISAVRASVGDRFPLMLDSGIRSGADVFKAIAGGADAVLVGRLQAYALSVAGALGVAHMIKLLRQEMEACMALSGCATLADVRDTDLVRLGAGR